MLQIPVSLEGRTSPFPDPSVETSGKNPLLTRFVDEGIPDFGFPGTVVDSNVANNAAEIDGTVINCVAAGRSTSPENFKCIRKNGESRRIGGTQKVVRFVHSLTNRRRPTDSVLSICEPDIVGVIAVEMGGKPRKVEFALVRMKNGLSNRPIGISKIDRIGKPVSGAVGALVPDASVRAFTFPGDIKIVAVSRDGRGLIALRTGPFVRRQIILLVLIRVGFICCTNAEENTISSGAVGEPDLTMPE